MLGSVVTRKEKKNTMGILFRELLLYPKVVTIAVAQAVKNERVQISHLNVQGGFSLPSTKARWQRTA